MLNKKVCLANCVFLLCTLGAVFFTSCKEDNPFVLSVDVEKKVNSYDGLWMLSHGTNIYGIDPASMEVKAKIKLNTFVSQPVVDSDGTMYVGDEGTDIGYFGNWIFSFNKNCSLKKQISAIPNISQIVCADSFVFADSLCMYGEQGKMGYAIIDKAEEKRTELNTNLDFWIAHSGKQWIYDNKIYLGIAHRVVDGGFIPITFYTLDTTTRELSTGMNDFTVPGGSQEQFYYTLAGGSLITSYGEQFMLRKYDLATKQKTGEVNAASYVAGLQAALDAQTEEEKEGGVISCKMMCPVVCNGKLYVFCVTANKELSALQGMLVLDVDTFAYEKFVTLEKMEEEFLYAPFYMLESCPDAVFFSFGENALKFSLTDGSLLVATPLN